MANDRSFEIEETTRENDAIAPDEDGFDGEEITVESDGAGMASPEIGLDRVRRPDCARHRRTRERCRAVVSALLSRGASRARLRRLAEEAARAAVARECGPEALDDARERAGGREPIALFHVPLGFGAGRRRAIELADWQDARQCDADRSWLAAEAAARLSVWRSEGPDAAGRARLRDGVDRRVARVRAAIAPGAVVLARVVTFRGRDFLAPGDAWPLDLGLGEAVAAVVRAAPRLERDPRWVDALASLLRAPRALLERSSASPRYSSDGGGVAPSFFGVSTLPSSSAKVPATSARMSSRCDNE